MTIKVKHIYDDTGYCRKYYRSTNNFLYCTQWIDNNGNYSWYNCTKDGEPIQELHNICFFIVG